MRMGVIAHADATRAVLEEGGHRYYAAFVTLTYALVCGWQPCHVSEYLDRLRKWCARRSVDLHYEWVMELQERGAPHYHIVLWLPHGFKVPKPDDEGWWTHGYSNIKRATRPVGYLVKYVSKGNNSIYTMPRGARLFQTGGHKCAALARHRACLPKWLRDEVPAGRARRVIGGWVSVESGEFFPSPWSLRWGYDDRGRAFVTIFKRFSAEKLTDAVDGSSSCVDFENRGEVSGSGSSYSDLSYGDLRELERFEREWNHFYSLQ